MNFENNLVCSEEAPRPIQARGLAPGNSDSHFNVTIVIILLESQAIKSAVADSGLCAVNIDVMGGVSPFSRCGLCQLQQPAG